MASKRPAQKKTTAKRATNKKTAPIRPAKAPAARPSALLELSRVLKKTGSFYYHCDWHALGASNHKDL